MFDECACSCDLDYDPADVQVSKVVTARKEHTCIECGDIIQPRQKYENYSLLFEGSWSKYKTCLCCVALRRDLYGKNGCWYFGELYDDFQQCFGFRPDEDPGEWNDDEE